MILPTPIKNANPFEWKCSNCGVMAFASLTLLIVAGSSPVGPGNGMARPFVKSLPNELRTRPAEMNPSALSALLQDGSNAAI